MLEHVRGPLLDEARRSPTLLSDLAGLEQYVAESYDSRSFIELLQNADDACASRFVIQRSGKFLLAANDGRRFNAIDFESLCRSAASSKSRGTSIGYRGIGFKSVVSFASTIYLISGDLATTFSRERTFLDVPQATRVPLIRIPHSLDDADRVKFATALDCLLSDGLTKVFVFENLLAGGIENEFRSFDATSLLFLRAVRQVELRTNTEAVITLRRDTIDTRTRAIRLSSDEGSSQWLVIEQNGIAVAFSRDADRVTRVNENTAVVHAFLPTLEATGLGVKIHGDISTDPSRTRVVFDERTAAGIKEIATLIVTLLEEGLSGKPFLDVVGIVAALIPFSDPRIVAFQRRTFKTDLFEAIEVHSKGRFENLRYRPTWLNAKDFETLSETQNLRIVPRNFDDVAGLSVFLKFLGAKEAIFDDLSPSLRTSTVTASGAAELVANLSQRYATKQIDIRNVKHDWKLWPVGGEMLSFTQAKAKVGPLDRDFRDLVREKSGIGSEARRLIEAISDKTTAGLLLPDIATVGNEQQFEKSNAQATNIIQGLSLKRWRSAEQQVLNLLAAQGWVVEDVSRQNIGYDIEGRTPEGENAFIEVKSIDYPNQAITLTSNEEAVARQKGERYQLAIVHQSEVCLEVAFIRNPIQHLKLTRQCRQWVWECGDYPFNAQRFSLE